MTRGEPSLNLRAYRATGAVITAFLRLLRIELRITGATALPDRPTLFVANHFTRFETLLVPYAIHRIARRPVRSLATHTLFHGWLGRYLRTVGVTSVRDPRRNRTIISELMTGRHDWVIYPEGGLIKSRRTVVDGRLHVEHPSREGPPRTGAALLALKAVMAMRRVRAAAARERTRRLDHYQRAYGVRDVADLAEGGVVIVPLTITFNPIRPRETIVSRLLRRWGPGMDPRLAEELRFESGLLLGRVGINVHVGEPLEVEAYLDRRREIARRLVGLFSEPKRTDLFIRRQAVRLTQDAMHRVYDGLEIGVDHLLCGLLRAGTSARLDRAELGRRLYLAAARIQERGDLRLHPQLGADLGPLLHATHPALESALELAEAQGVVRRDGDALRVDRAVMTARTDFHRIRLERTVQVLANELDAARGAAAIVREVAGLGRTALRAQTAETIHRRERDAYRHRYRRAFTLGLSRPRGEGEPYWLEAPGAVGAVVLVHGYLGSPEQVRPLAEHLHAAGWSVYAVRLPGHGTAPVELVDVRWRQWLDALHRGIAAVERHGERVVVGGFSLGAALALLAAAQRPHLAGAFAINAPLRLRDPRAPFVPALVGAHGLLRRLGLARDHAGRSNEHTECPETNYRHDYLAGVREVRRAMAACRRALPAVTVPTLVVQSDRDPVVAPASAEAIAERIGAATCRLVRIESDRHVIIRGPGCDELFRTVDGFLGEAVPPRAGEPVRRGA